MFQRLNRIVFLFAMLVYFFMGVSLFSQQSNNLALSLSNDIGMSLSNDIAMSPSDCLAMSPVDSEGQLSVVFVILAHVSNANHETLWRRCYESIRTFYPTVKIVIIDDNSRVPLALEDINVQVIRSEYPGAGELLPYYYFLKHKWANKMIFLHDSMFLRRAFTDSELQNRVKFHWHFTSHGSDSKAKINAFLKMLNYKKSLLSYNRHKELWFGCFGVTSMIDLDVIVAIENKYGFTNRLKNVVKTRNDRMAIERVFAILLFLEKYMDKENCSNFGCIFGHPHAFGACDAAALEHAVETYSGAIIKTWHGR